ncbi:MAG: 3-dehydroquinate synthase [Burkholderiaceae bacterium]
MHELTVELGDRSYPILIGDGLISGQCDALLELAEGRQVAVVTDDIVAGLHLTPMVAQLKPVAHELIEVALPAGESNKTWSTLNLIFDALLAARFDRRCLIVALGGGVIGDMAGLAAALYQRGVDFVQVPTTLLAQVDSSVGGKTAINHPAGKNMIGAFYQPRLVIADSDVLTTLPARQISAGLAEMIKHGAIADLGYLAQMERDLAAMRAAQTNELAAAVFGSCQIKAAVVADDEREAGRRAILNFGHTFGHAIEAGLGYGRWLHGEAVGTGMLMAADLSRRCGFIDQSFVDRLETLCARTDLPLRAPGWPAARYLELMAVDKKSRQGVPRFVLLDAPGAASLHQVNEQKVAETLAALATAAA